MAVFTVMGNRSVCLLPFAIRATLKEKIAHSLKADLKLEGLLRSKKRTESHRSCPPYSV